MEKHSHNITAGADFAHNSAESMVFFGSMFWGFIKDIKSILEQGDVSANGCCRSLGGACESQSKEEITLCY